MWTQRKFEEIEAPPIDVVSCGKPDGTVHGPVAQWVEGHLWMAGNYRDGQPDGVVFDLDGAGGASWWDAGVRRRSIRWNRSGVATYEEVVEGEEERVTMRHDSGALKAKMTWRDEEIDGRYETWHESGQKRLEGRYEHGKRVGAWSCWDAQGAALHASYGDTGELLGLDEEAMAAWRSCVRPIGSKDPSAPEIPAAIE